MCASSAPISVPTSELEHYVNFSNCVYQNEIIELYVLSDYKDASYGKYDILGKIIQLEQETYPSDGRQGNFSNTTTFEELSVCHIQIGEGYVQNITCADGGVGYENSVQMFDMLHDLLRYLLPRLQRRLYEGSDIAEDSLFGYSLVDRGYENNSTDHIIRRSSNRESLKNETYGNATTDLLWNYENTVGRQDTEMKYMNFSLIHTFSQLPHHDETQQIKLFTWCGYQLQLLNKQEISSSKTNELKEMLYDSSTSNPLTKNYTIEQWRGIRTGNFIRRDTSHKKENETNSLNRRRLGKRAAAANGIRKFCETYNKLAGGWDEMQIEFFSFELWVSELIQMIRKDISPTEFFSKIIDRKGAVERKPLQIIPPYLSLDTGMLFEFGLTWSYKDKPNHIPNYRPDFYKDSFGRFCPASFKKDRLSMDLPEYFEVQIGECCHAFDDYQKDCSITLQQAHKKGNECLKKRQFCETMKEVNQKKTYKSIWGKPAFEFNDNFAGPSLNSFISLALFAADKPWDWKKKDFIDLAVSLVSLLFPSQSTCWPKWGKALHEAAEVLAQTNPFRGVRGYKAKRTRHGELLHFLLDSWKAKGQFQERVQYWRHKREHCDIKPKFYIPFGFKMDVVLDLGFMKPSIGDFCSVYQATGLGESTESSAPSRRILLAKTDSNTGASSKIPTNTGSASGAYVSIPLIPEIILPCIPIAPPALMLCPGISFATNVGLGFDSNFNEEEIGVKVSPTVSVDLSATLSITLGVPVLYAQVQMGVSISFVWLQFPVNVGVNLESQNFGLFGDIGVDFKVLQLSIFLKFQVCGGTWIFKFCAADVTLWSLSHSEYRKKITLWDFGMGSNTGKNAGGSKTNLQDTEQTVIRFYWAFKDNDEYPYNWEKHEFSNFFVYDTWATSILNVLNCDPYQPKNAYISQIEWKNSTFDTITNPNNVFNCQHALSMFDKVLMTEITMEWYDYLSKTQCFQPQMKQIFDEDSCCDFALLVYEQIKELTGKDTFELSSYKMVIVDINQNYKCAEYYLNTEVQITATPWYDDCSDSGWSISSDLNSEYQLGLHDIYAHGLTHYNNKPTCLNLFASANQKIVKTKRTFEINFSYDLLMIGLRFWAQPTQAHGSSHFYGIKLHNAANYNWISNVNGNNCLSFEEAYSDWKNVNDELSIDPKLQSDYCYIDVLMYIDPFMNTNRYKIDLEIIANVPAGESWGFSHLVLNTFDDEYICTHGVYPVIELTTNYTNEDDIEYEYYGLKDVPSLYYGYVFFDISFDYRFHDIAALISLSSDNSNNGNTDHWVISFDHQESGIWIRYGNDKYPSKGILTLNEQLSNKIVDRNNNNERIFTKMYIEWNTNPVDDSYFRIGLGDTLGLDLIASVDYYKFGIDTDYMIKYVGFARSFGSKIPDVDWKIYVNNLPSYCLSESITEKTQNMNNYKQNCLSNEVANAKVIIHDLVKPNCIYYNQNDWNYALSYKFTIPQSHHYVMMGVKLFAGETTYINISVDSESDNHNLYSAQWEYSSSVCRSKTYEDDISKQLTTRCTSKFDSTFVHTSQHETFTVSLTATDTYGVSDITLHYGSCHNILPLIPVEIRYEKKYFYMNSEILPSILDNYIFALTKSQLDQYESSELYISLGTQNENEKRYIVRFYFDTVEIWYSYSGNSFFGNTLLATSVAQDNIPYINNQNWLEFYVEWDEDDRYLRVGKRFVLGKEQIVSTSKTNFQQVTIDTIGIMHANKNDDFDWNVIEFQFVTTDEQKLCWTEELAALIIPSWVNTELYSIWFTNNDEPTMRIPTELTTNLIFNGPFDSGDSLSKTFATITHHDYIQLNAKIFGFGSWDVIYATWLNNIGLILNENDDDKLIWFGTFLSDGGDSNQICSISQYKQWFDWKVTNSLEGFPESIFTNQTCYYDINIYLKHSAMCDPFSLSFIADLQQ
eukprot:382091_1